MGRSRRRPLLIGCLGLGAVGCEPGPEFIATDSLRATIRVLSFESGSGAASLRVSTPDGEPTRLSSTNEVSVAVPGWNIDIPRPSDGPDPVYSTTLPEAPPLSPVNLAVLRDDSDSAPFNGVTLPPAFTDLSVSDSWSRSTEDLMIAWSDTGESDPIVVTIEGACIQPFEETYTAQAEGLLIAAGQLKTQDALPDTECPVTLVLARVRVGSPDDAWYEAEIEARTQVERSLMVVP